MLTEEQALKIAGPKATLIDYAQAEELLSEESGQRPRIYGYHNGQIVKLASVHYLQKYAPERIWISGTTLADLVRKA